jgi:hypothetical protein
MARRENSKSHYEQSRDYDSDSHSSSSDEDSTKSVNDGADEEDLTISTQYNNKNGITQYHSRGISAKYSSKHQNSNYVVNERSLVSVNSSITGENEIIRLNQIYKQNLKEELNLNTRDLVRKEIRKRIWSNTKFTNMDIVNNVCLTEEGTFLNEILIGLNKLQYSECERLMFWNRYGKEVVDMLATIRCNVSTMMKAGVLKGEIFFIYFIIEFYDIF